MNDYQPTDWVLLRGLTREHRHWQGFPGILRKQLPESITVLPDLPGTGRHNKETSPTSIREILEFIRADIGVHLFPQPIYILALSMGGMVAIEWARRYPNECAGVVLMNTSLNGLSPFKQRLRPQNYFRLIHGLFFSHSKYHTERMILELTSNLTDDRESVVDDWVTYAKENPVSKPNAIRQLIAAGRYRVPEEKPDVPILLLNSIEDRLVDPTCSQALADAWDLEIESHPAAGHDLTLDDGEWVCEQIKQWLADSDWQQF